jgi:hypothetical protein
MTENILVVQERAKFKVVPFLPVQDVLNQEYIHFPKNRGTSQHPRVLLVIKVHTEDPLIPGAIAENIDVTAKPDPAFCAPVI